MKSVIAAPRTITFSDFITRTINSKYYSQRYYHSLRVWLNPGGTPNPAAGGGPPG